MVDFSQPCPELEVGEHAWYRGKFGSAFAVLVQITGKGEKNGKRVYDCDNGRWGYADQFQRASND